MNKKIYSIYGQAKLFSTIFLMKENKKNNFPSVIIRPYLIYGPFQTPNRLIPYSIISCLKRKKFSLFKWNTNKRFFICN